MYGIKDRAAWEEAGIALPGYDVEAVSARAKEAPVWVHFGIGNIFRIFIGGIADGLLEEGVLDRGITCVETFDYDVVDKIYEPCMFEECYLQQLLIKILAKASVNAAVPEKFPVIVREGVNEQGEKLRFYLNYSWEEQRVEVADDFEVVLGNGDSTKHEIYLSAWDVCIIKFEK